MTYWHPVNQSNEELTLKVDSGTGFEEGVHFEDLKQNELISVDYEETTEGILRAVQVKRVPLNETPEKFYR